MATGYQGYSGYGDPQRAKVDRARQMAELLQQGATDTSPKSFWEGAAQLGKAFIARGAMDKADKAETEYGATMKDRNSRLASVLMPDASGIANDQLNTAAPFDLTPNAMGQRAQQGGENARYRPIVEALLGEGNLGGAVDFVGDQQQMAAQRAEAERKAKEPKIFNQSNGIFAVTPDLQATLIEGTQPTPKPTDLPEGMWYGQDGKGPPQPIPGYVDMRARIAAAGRASDGGGSAPPSGYRWNPDGSLAKIPGGPADKPEPGLYTPTEEKNYRGKAQALNTLKFLTNEYRTLVNQYGPGLFDATLKDGEWQKTPEGQKLLASHNNLMMFLKGPELFNLGVLTGPDVERLQRTLPEPVGMGAFGQSKETLGIGLDSLDQLVGYQMTMIPEEMRAVQGGGGDAVAKPAAPAPMSFMNRRMQGVQSALTPAPMRQPAPRQQPVDLSQMSDEELERALAEAEGR